MPISALPSPYGIGSLGREAGEFADFLAMAKQSWWQILPAGPTSIGDSPYQSQSAYAGNPWFIDLGLLEQDSLLDKGDAESLFWGDDPSKIRYDLLYQNRPKLLHKAASRGLIRDAGEVEAFREREGKWLSDYALFMALKKHFGMKSWQKWPDEDLRMRRPDALAKAKKELAEDVDYYTYIQFLFFRQWEAFRTEVHEKGIRLMGDMALYVAMDSADVWAAPENFLLDERNTPVKVAGVPPDQFTDDGQLWGNPLYDYEHMAEDGFCWMLDRIRGASRLYDAIRIDHFRGLESYWAVPYGEDTAKNGTWVKGPGMALVQKIKDSFPDIRFVAEDLGYPTPEVAALLKASGFPGMKVLEFSFDSRDPGSLPHTFEKNCVCYSGTHDNDTLKGWLEHADPADVHLAQRYLGLNQEEGFVRGILRGGMSSQADLFIAQIQDWLGLGHEARMNTPGTLSGNWQWRIMPGQLTKELAEEIAEMTNIYGRDPAFTPEIQKGEIL